MTGGDMLCAIIVIIFLLTLILPSFLLMLWFCGMITRDFIEDVWKK